MMNSMQGVPYARLRGFPVLFSTYCTRWEHLAEFYAEDWRDEASYRTLADQLQSPISVALADALTRQNERWHNPVTAQIRMLLEPGALAVVTGQQVGLFGGPLYTFYKALTTVRLARKLEDVTQRPVVPVFWLEGGDHDLLEVSTLHIPAGDSVKPLLYRDHTFLPSANVGSVGRLSLQPDIDRVREELCKVLPPTEFRNGILEDYFGAYRVGTTFTDAFARTMVALLRGSPLVLIDPEDAAIKQLAAPLFERALLEHADILERLEVTSRRLARNYHVQVQPRATALFYQDESGRHAVRPEEAGFTVQKRGQALSVSTVVDRIRVQPHQFSPNVVLRPLLQDMLMPTVAYVAGPGEVSYFAQYKSLYDWAGLAMPILYPRASITILEPSVRRVLRRYSLTMVDLAESTGALLERMLIHGSAQEEAFTGAEHALSGIVAELSPVVAAVDATLQQAVHATGAAWGKDLDRLRRRVRKAEKRKHGVLRSQLSRAQAAAFPCGKLQERVVPAMYFLSKYGPEFLNLLQDGRLLETASHQTLQL